MRNLAPQPADLPELLRRDGQAGWSLLTWLADAGYLTSDLVALRYYPTPQGVRTASYRLAQMAAWGLAARRPLRRTRLAWHLTDQGARLVADYLRTTPKEIGYDGKEGLVHEAFVLHNLAVTQFEVALRVHAQQRGGQVLRFAREPVIQTDTGPLKPDASFTYAQGTSAWHYTVEIDRNTETPAYFAASKVHKYDALARGPWQLHFEQIPTCLVVVQAGGPSRAARLKAAIDNLPISDGDYRLYKFVAAQDLYDIPDSHRGALPRVLTHFTSPVCRVARKAESERRAVFT